MAEDRNQFTSIYGDAEDEFEVDDISDETLTIPTDEIRAVRAEEIADETDAETADHAAEAGEHAPVEDEEPAERQAEPTAAEVTENAADQTVEGEDSGLDDDPEGKDSDVDDDSEDEDLDTDDDLEGVSFEDHDAGYAAREEGEPDYRDEEPEDYGREEDEEPDADKVSVLSYIGHAILFTIPVIGTILMLVYIISGHKNPHLRHLAQIWLITLLLICVGLVVAAYMLGLA